LGTSLSPLYQIDFSQTAANQSVNFGFLPPIEELLSPHPKPMPFRDLFSGLN
jgi:hypothetical protein